MAFNDQRRAEFLSRARGADPDEALGTAAVYNVELEPADVLPGQSYWRVIGVHHLTPAENQGKHAVYVDIIDADGNRVRDPNLRLRWGWAGQRADEAAPPKSFDKPDNEPATNVDIYVGQRIWIEMSGDGLPSDRVSGMHTQHDDEPGPHGQTWNSYGHHSFYVVFQRTVMGEEAEGKTKEEGAENGAGEPVITEPVITEPVVTEPVVTGPVITEPPVTLPQTGNKLGFYFHISTNQDNLWEAIRRVQPPVMLVHADTANKMLLQEIRRFRAPDAFVIGRLYKDNHTQRMMLEHDPAGNGQRMAEEILAYDFGLATQKGENGRPLIDAWMSLNETVPGPNSDQFQEKPEETARLLHNYDLFQVAFRRRLQEAGVEAVAFNFGAGNFAEAEHYLDHFPNTLAEYVYLGFHEYGWPTMYPAATSATSAGTYRRCLDGIRARYGDRHRVIITEAGLTRMYMNPQWGDKGWLNVDAPLTEDQYWQSLAWYNGYMLEDDYVLGACLYEVGHHGDWVTFRHLGKDDDGRDIRLIDRIVALKEGAAQAAAVPAPVPAPVPALAPITIHGTVTLQGQAVAGATVRLIGGGETLGGQRNAALHAPHYVTWSRRTDAIEGSLWAVWQREVAQAVAGISWPEFRRTAVQYNPDLYADDGEFVLGKRYWLPENSEVVYELVWDRPMTGFDGNLWMAWQRFVQNKVLGLDYARFKQLVVKHNPELKKDGRFVAAKQYNLPRNAEHKKYALHAWSNSRGGYSFKDVPPGSYELVITAPGALPYSTGFSCLEETVINVALLPTVEPAPVDVAAAPAVAGHDFVRVHGNEFVEQSRVFRFIGVNIRGLAHYGDPNTLRYSVEGHREEQLRAAYEMGARVVRIFLPTMHADADETVRRLRAVLDLVRDRYPGLYILPAFANLYADVPFRIPGDEGFYARIDPNFHAELLTAAFFTGGYGRHYLPFVRKVVTAFRDEPIIFAWEIGNELKLDPAGPIGVDNPHLNAFISFMHLAAREIRNLDPNHLVTTGMISTRHASLVNDALKRRLYDTPLFDFMTIHCYNEEYHEDDSGLAHILGMPYIVEEAGFGNKYGQDRSGHVRRDMDRWFSAGDGARGYMQWGFMATSNDMGDGDGDSGMDRSLHHDWDPLFSAYRERATHLAQHRPEINLPPKPVRPPKPSGFVEGGTIYAHTVVNVRASAGHIAKPDGDVLGQMALGAEATVLGASAQKDGLIWWPIRATLTSGATVDAWAAEAIPGQILLSAARPLWPNPGMPTRKYVT